jgi:hypothetical protein
VPSSGMAGKHEYKHCEQPARGGFRVCTVVASKIRAATLLGRSKLARLACFLCPLFIPCCRFSACFSGCPCAGFKRLSLFLEAIQGQHIDNAGSRDGGSLKTFKYAIGPRVDRGTNAQQTTQNTMKVLPQEYACP